MNLLQRLKIGAVIFGMMMVAAALSASRATNAAPSPAAIEFYQLDSSKIVVYRGGIYGRAITHQELGDLVKELNRSAATLFSKP